MRQWTTKWRRREYSHRPEEQRALLLEEVRLLIRLGFFDEAQAILQVKLEAVRDAACLNLLGVIEELRSRWARAQKFYRHAVRADAAFQPARQNIRRMYELFTFGRSDQSIALGDERRALGMLLQVTSNGRKQSEACR
jgi:hypothetical protein